MISTTILSIISNVSCLSEVRVTDNRFHRFVCLFLRIALLFVAVVLSNNLLYAQAPDKCGSPSVIEQLREGKMQSLGTLLVPPSLSDSLISPSGRFMIHFAKSGRDSASNEFVQAVAEYADEAYELEIVQLGYPKPPYSFGDSMWHIYLHDFVTGTYGKTFPTDEGSFSRSPSGLQRFRSFIEMDNDYPQNQYPTSGLDAARITVFHEFHHVVQFGDYGIDLSSDIRTQIYVRFQEMTSTWMESRSTPGVIDYTYYMPSYFKNIDLTFPLATTDFGYSESVWLYYLAKRFGDDVVRKTWERYSDIDNDFLASTENTLLSYNSDFCAEYKKFGVQLFATGRRNTNSTVFADAKIFPVDALKVNHIPIGVPTSYQALVRASLNLFVAGDSRDSSVIAVSRNIDPTKLSNATIKFTSLNTFENQYDYPETFCDTIVKFSPADAVVFPQPFILQDGINAEPMKLLASNGSKKPVSDPDLTIYSVDMTLIRRIVAPPEAFGGTWYLNWDGKDDIGKLVPSGIYVYTILIDGEKKSGKMVVVRK